MPIAALNNYSSLQPWIAAGEKFRKFANQIGAIAESDQHLHSEFVRHILVVRTWQSP